MKNYNPTYLGEISLDEETLAHYGVKGMKWHHRRGSKKVNRRKNKRRHILSRTSIKTQVKNNGLADRINSWLDDHTDSKTTTTTKSYSGSGDYYTPHTTERYENGHHTTTTTTRYPAGHHTSTTERDEGNHHINTTTTTYAPGYSETTETTVNKRKKKK